MITEARKIARAKAQKLSVKPKPKPRFDLPYKRKCWGKTGHAIANIIARAQYGKQKFEDDLNYAS